jgi:purine-binding chemotaxis protein CheW
MGRRFETVQPLRKENAVKEDKSHSSSAPLVKWLEFRVGNEDFAVPLLLVREVISIPDTTPIPRSPDHFVGLMNLRGKVISIVDLRKKLKLPVPPKATKEEVVIIVDLGGLSLGVLVDAINRVLAFPDEEISKVPELQLQISAEFIHGVYQKEHSLTVLVDMGKILDVADLKVANAA